MSYPIETISLQPQPMVASEATTTPAELAQAIGQSLGEVWKYLVEQRGIQPAGPPFVIYHHFSPEQITIEAGLPLSQPITTTDSQRVKVSFLPAGDEVAHTWHIGPYDTLSQTYDTIRAWMQEHGKEMAGPSFEFYWTDPADNPDPSTWRTEIFQPVK